MKWRKATWWPEYLESIGEAPPPSTSHHICEEFWSPSDKKWPLWGVSLSRSISGGGFTVSVDYKSAQDAWWVKADCFKGFPPFILKRLGMMIDKHLKKKEKA